MTYFLTLVFVIFSLVFCSCIRANIINSPCNFDVKIKQALYNAGFHMNLTYGIVFNADNERAKWLYQDCLVAVDQVLPSGVYANPDEVNDLNRMQKTNIIVGNRVDIEASAEDSEPINVLVMGQVLSSKVVLWLPIHARYHASKPGGGQVTIRIAKPKLYLRCPDQRLEACNKNISLSRFLCNGGSKEKCSWREIPYTSATKRVVYQEIPVGNLNHFYLVSTGTAAVVFVGALYIIQTIHNYKMNERRKKMY